MLYIYTSIKSHLNKNYHKNALLKAMHFFNKFFYSLQIEIFDYTTILNILFGI